MNLLIVKIKHIPISNWGILPPSYSSFLQTLSTALQSLWFSNPCTFHIPRQKPYKFHLEDVPLPRGNLPSLHILVLMDLADHDNTCSSNSNLHNGKQQCYNTKCICTRCSLTCALHNRLPHKHFVRYFSKIYILDRLDPKDFDSPEEPLS